MTTDHFERLLEEACLNHMYPVKHKLKDYVMMKNFMTSGSLTRDKEPKGDSGGGGTTPFLDEEVVMMVYDGCSPTERRRVSNLSPGTLTRCS
jgi:hypothetical protein